MVLVGRRDGDRNVCTEAIRKQWHCGVHIYCHQQFYFYPFVAINLLLIYRGENNGDALGHARNSAVAIDALQSRADHPSALVREHVAWALERHSSNNEDSRRLKNK